MGKLGFAYHSTPIKLDKLSLLGLLFALLTTSGAGQSLSVKQYFKSALEDGYYKSFDQQDLLLQNQQGYSLPWINKVQVLYQDNQFNNYQTRYALRFYPGNPLQIQSNKRYFQGYKVLKSLEQKLVLKEILKDRYELVINYWMADELVNLTTQQKALRENIGRTMEQMVGSSNFDPDQFLTAQLDILAKETDWHELSLERDVALSRILVNGNETKFELNQSALINVDQINQTIQSLTNSNRTEYSFLKQRAEVSDLKMKLEKSNFDLGYIQGVYGSDRQLDGQNTVGLSFGVAIPIINPNKEDITREKLTTIERQGKLEQFQQQENAKIQHAATNLQLHLLHYQKVDSLISSIKEKQINAITGRSNNYNPIIELKYQEKIIQLDILKLKIKKQILLQYVSFLDASDKLHERPLLNYLSRTLEAIEN